MSTTTRTSPARPSPLEDEGIDLLKLVSIFLSEWKIGAIGAVVVFIICATITFMWTPVFEAKASLLPHESGMQVTGLMAMLSTKSPEDMYLGLLESRTVADQVIDRVDLLNAFHTKSRASARGMLTSASKFTIGKDTIVKIRVRDKDAQRAAAIANAYLDALQSQQQAMSEAQAKLRSVVFEKQMDEEKAALAAAEIDLKKEQETSGLVQINAQTEIGLSAIANVRAQITSLQVQLAALSATYTAESPQVKTLKSQIAGLESQEHNLESGSSGGVGTALPTGKMPAANLEYLRKFREVKYHEALLAALANQYESAHLAEGNSVTEFQIVDRAIAPERKSWPPRILFLALSVVFGIMAGCVLITLTIFARRLYADPVQREYLHAIRDNFRFSR
jgi:uncharacterized protein involved in exopolysaccharide biosynthesis